LPLAIRKLPSASILNRASPFFLNDAAVLGDTDIVFSAVTRCMVRPSFNWAFINIWVLTASVIKTNFKKGNYLIRGYNFGSGLLSCKSQIPALSHKKILGLDQTGSVTISAFKMGCEVVGYGFFPQGESAEIVGVIGLRLHNWGVGAVNILTLLYSSKFILNFF